MPSFAVVIDTKKLERAADTLTKLDSRVIGNATLGAVQDVTQRAYDESLRRMTSRVNLTRQYVEERMLVEAANDPNRPEGKVIALRTGGRRPGIRPVNLRQYAPIVSQQAALPNPSGQRAFKMKDGRDAYLPFSQNPRKPGGFLPFVKRTGSSLLNIPVGKKQGPMSVEVVKGQRKTLQARNGFAPFLQRMPSGQILVMARTNKNGNVGGKGKGKIQALYSLSVWQLFRSTAAQIIPLVQRDLNDSVSKALEVQLNKVFK